MTNKEGAVVLLSSGLDSSVNLLKAMQELEVKLVLTLNYGQKAIAKELEFSKKLCDKYNLKHSVLEIKWLSELATSSLVDDTKTIPTDDQVDINSLEQSKISAKSVWVSNRNGLFINIAASFAEELDAKYIIVGFNKEEAATFPDNSIEFIEATNSALKFSTRNAVEVKSFTSELYKKDIVKLGRALNLDFDLIWPCYFSGDSICKTCESCKRYLAALS